MGANFFVRAFFVGVLASGVYRDEWRLAATVLLKSL
jgi:hypothetical protein